MHITEPIIEAISTVNPLIPSNQKVEQGTQEGQEDDDQYPHYLIISPEIIHQNTDQGKKRKKNNKKDYQKGQQDTSTK